MTFVIETGVAVRGANAYVPVAYVTAYLTARNRQTENLWSTSSATLQHAAIVAATDYVEKRFAHRFVGVPKVTFEESYAEASLVFGGLPAALDDLILGDETYVFVSSLSGDTYEVLISGTAAGTAANLGAAINGAAGGGITYGLRTPQSRHSTALAAGATLTLTALAPGAGGALTVLLGPVTNLAITGFSGGKDGGLQPLSFPRSYAYDQQGNEILGIPDRLKQAVAEYAVRALASGLLPDPTVDPYGGRIVKRSETVGPINESVQYDPGSVGTVIFTPYPSADRLLTPLLLGSGNGGVIRA